MTSVEIPVEIWLPEPDSPRTEGIHVSSIIRCIAIESGILKTDQAEELSLVDVRKITDEKSILRINIGLAWEKHYSQFLPEVIDHPGEMELDGIYMTHDGESVSVIVRDCRDIWSVVCHEYKSTYKSTKTVGNLDSQWMWISQIKAYCKALKTRHAEVHVLFLCGDYSFPISPLMKRWRVEFSQEEIDKNWDLLRDYRDYVLGLKQTSLEEL